MQIGPGSLCLLLLFVSGAMFLGASANVSQHWFETRYGDYLIEAAKYTAQGSIAFAALSLYEPHKTKNVELAKAWITGFATIGTDILGRAETARDAIETLATVGAGSPGQLPVACTTEFSDVAAYCAGWRQRDRRRYWGRELSNRFELSNMRLFDFLLTLEISRVPDPATLAEKRDAALVSLDRVIDDLRRALHAPL